MTKLLIVETSARAENSVSRAMTQRFLSHWQARHPASTIVRRDLAAAPPPFVDGEWLRAYLTPPPQQDGAMRQALALSDTLVAELQDADHLVLATPVYNYNVPAALKSWIDHIVRKGLTLGLDGAPLLHGKQATLLIASGASYGEGSPIRERDIATQYLRLILGVIGITDVTVVAGGGAKAVDLGERSMDDFLASLDGELAQRGRSGAVRG